MTATPRMLRNSGWTSRRTPNCSSVLPATKCRLGGCCSSSRIR
jgi:hypothetical protein